jgi:tRNA(Arg) A34 adenosine deaminase TadA
MGQRHGCAVLDRHGRIVSVACNRRHRNDHGIRSRLHDKNTKRFSICAEIRALQKAGKRAIGGTIVVVRLGARGNLLLSRPCVRCLKAIRKARVRRVYFSNNDGGIEKINNISYIFYHAGKVLESSVKNE